MKIITLGTGNAFASNGRASTSILIDGSYKILLDCSPQAIQSLRKLNTVSYTHLTLPTNREV